MTPNDDFLRFWHHVLMQHSIRLARSITLLFCLFAFQFNFHISETLNKFDLETLNQALNPSSKQTVPMWDTPVPICMPPILSWDHRCLCLGKPRCLKLGHEHCFINTKMSHTIFLFFSLEYSRFLWSEKLPNYVVKPLQRCITLLGWKLMCNVHCIMSQSPCILFRPFTLILVSCYENRAFA